MDRLIIPTIEGRILTGIVMFVAIMLLIGWVAINEPARMASFEEQHIGRATERGAELYAANCSTCHGTDGRGGPQAPALNNPHLFSYDFTGGVNSEIAARERALYQDNIPRRDDLLEEREELLTEISQAETSEERRVEIVSRLEEIDAALLDLEERNATLRAELEPLYEEREALLAEIEPALSLPNSPYLPRLDEVRAEAEETDNPFLLTDYIAQDTSRLAQIRWEADLRSYLVTTLMHGRPGSADVWPESAGGMVAWGQIGGGPLRTDQIEDITEYILNWDRGDNWTNADLNSVNAFARLHGGMAGGGDMAGGESIDVVAITESVLALEGDPDNGAALYTAQGCTGCHNNAAVGPATAGTFSRVESERLTLDEFADYSVEQYIIESIVAPNAYVVEGYPAGVMQQNYWTDSLLSEQDLADLLAYLRTQG